MTKRCLVTGSGGFIGSWLVKRLKSEGYWVRGVDIKRPEFEPTAADEFLMLDLRGEWEARQAVKGINDVYQLAADMGGIKYITENLASISANNTRINLNMLDAAKSANVDRYLYTSSACVYNQNFQDHVNATPLKEEDAWPALPEEGYGLEKLYAEKMVEWYTKDYGLDTRTVRFHNVYGSHGTFDGGKEKSPAAICRKIAKTTEPFEEIEIWGDGKQTRTYMAIQDCIEGLRRIMESEYQEPLNLGTDESFSINELANKISVIADKTVILRHVEGPQGVRGRSSDNTLARKILGWEPQIKLSEGLVPTYRWINEQVNGVKK